MGKIKIICSGCGVSMEKWPSEIKNKNIELIICKKCLNKKMAEFYKANRIEKICEECGKGFLLSNAVASKKGSGRFCSLPCKHKHFYKKPLGRRKENNIIEKASHYEMIIKNKKGVFTVLFDLDDLDKVNQYKWFIGSHGYACAHIPASREMILMHRLILNTPDDMDTDHANHNTYDNRKGNIRICTTAQNLANIPFKGGKKYKGVHKSRNGTFYAKNANIHLGTFATPELAAQVYNDVVKTRYGNFAQLNKI